MPERFSEIDDGIYRGGAPSGKDLQILSNIFGIKRIISLDEKVGNKISPIVKELGIEHIIIPLQGPETIHLFNYLSDNIVDLLTDNKPSYIHCLHGKDRTGTAAALYRIKHDNWDVDKALEEAKQIDFGKDLDPSTKAFYTLFIKRHKTDANDVTDEDIVSLERDWFNMGNVPPAFMPQQSWAPKTDVNRPSAQFPFANRKRRRMGLRKMRLQDLLREYGIDLEEVPLVGQYDNYSGIRGVGPVENQGFVSLY